MTVAAEANRSLHGLSYRPEVDGLRAVAVLPVMLFHAGLTVMPGGFFGVDVFFVISGYLITRILLNDLEQQRYSILRFYERRARRILPALFLVMAFTIVPAFKLLPPEQLNIYFGSLRATALFYSNIFFHQNTGYFSPSAENQPLLHTWSLAVEEQFYVVFPLLLWLLWRIARQRLTACLAILGLVGFSACLWQLSKNADAAFYLFHARAWELLVGAVLASGHASRASLSLPALFRNLSSLAGLGLILAGYLLVPAPQSVPGWPTLLPVVGTALVLATAGEGTVAGQILSWRPLVGIGLISYSAYLWHQPLYAFARLAPQGEPSAAVMIFLAALALGLAALSWRFVELPFRQQPSISGRHIFASAGAGIAAFSIIAALALHGDWSRQRFTPEQLAHIDPPQSRRIECAWITPLSQAPGVRLCNLNEGAGQPVLLWGDSHAQALADELTGALKAARLPGFYISSHRCLRIPGIASGGSANDEDEEECSVVRSAFYDYLKALKPRAIVVSMRWPLRLFPVPGSDDHVAFDNGEGGLETEEDRLNFARAPDGNWVTDAAPKRKAVIDMFPPLAAIAPVVVVGPVPEVGWTVGDINFKELYLRNKALPEVSTSYARFLQRNQFTLDALAAAEQARTIQLVDPHRLLCDTVLKGRCLVQQAGKTYYADDDHLSDTGARLVIEQVMAKIAH